MFGTDNRSDPLKLQLAGTVEERPGLTRGFDSESEGRRFDTTSAAVSRRAQPLLRVLAASGDQRSSDLEVATAEIAIVTPVPTPPRLSVAFRRGIEGLLWCVGVFDAAAIGQVGSAHSDGLR
jgi:hypothetical protein